MGINLVHSFIYKRKKTMHKKIHIKECIAENMFRLSSMTAITMIIIICVYLFGEGILFFQKYSVITFLTSSDWEPVSSPESFGILPMIVTSLLTTVLSIGFAFPIGIAGAVFLSFYCPKRYYGFLKSLVNLMAAIPSIIYGFFSLMVLVPVIRKVFPGNGMNILTASLLLGLMILPTIICISESSINMVNKNYFLSSMALGATKEESIVKVVLKVARLGILSSVILAIGRSIGETMAVYMVIGNQALMPSSLFHGARSLTTNIVLEMGYAGEFHMQALIATACVLFVFILMINTMFFFVKRKMAA